MYTNYRNLIKQRDLASLVQYQKSLFQKPRLRFLFFELTDSCNLSCLHCGSNCISSNQRYLPYEAIEKVLFSILKEYEPHEVMICITGGEPMLHPDIFEIVSLSHHFGFPVGMTTNGTLIDHCAAVKLKESGLDTIAISIDGTEKVHDHFRNCKGSFKKALEGARNLKKAGIEPQAITVVSKNNINALEDLYSLLKNEEFYSWRLTNIDPIGRANDNQELLLDFEEMEYLLNYIREKRYDNKNNMDVTFGCSHYVTTSYEREVRDFYFQCGAGTLVGSVMANGNIGACLDIERREELIQGNIYENEFLDVWNNRFQIFRENRADKSEMCSQCSHSKFCMGDSAHTWDYDNNEPRYCWKQLKERKQRI